VATVAHSEPAESAAQFCWRVLADVSRSFAVVIRELPHPLNDAVMVSYLLCRIADSVEDSSLPLTEKQNQLRRLPAVLDDHHPGETFAVFSVPETYRELMARPEAVFGTYRALDHRARAAIRTCVAEMCEGMAEWTGRTIETIADQDRYCYYVAGVVGKLLTELFYVYGQVSRELADRLAMHAVEFGLALQKINILRDVRADMQEGRCYWPEELLRKHGTSRASLLDPAKTQAALAVIDDLVRDVVPYCARALLYVELLPATRNKLRSFCAIPLFMATATARVCQANADVVLADSPVKISRAEAKRIVLRAKLLGWSNAYLRRWFRRDVAALNPEM
jgi:farnesyl-diphosphate farnesyltransferase